MSDMKDRVMQVILAEADVKKGFIPDPAKNKFSDKNGNLKCPFCNKPLQPTLRLSDEYWCKNYDCPRTNIEWVGSQKLWQELIRTRKALDVATKYIKHTQKVSPFWFNRLANETLDKIKTALEQKDEQ